MRLALALFLNAALLAVVLPWLRRQWCAVGPAGRLVLAVGLGGRLLVGGIKGLHLVHDAAEMTRYSRMLSRQLWEKPGPGLQSMLGNELHFRGDNLVLHGLSNTYFFSKILAVLNFASLETDWLNAVYLSLFSFVGCWMLAITLARVFPRTPAWAGVLAFVVWPSVLFWSSGVTKEAALLASGAGVLAVVVRVLFGASLSGRKRLVLAAAGLALAAVHLNMRYFFAVPLLLTLAGLVLVSSLQQLGLARRRWGQAVVLAVVLGVAAWVAPHLSPAFRVNKFTNQLVRIYGRHLSKSVDKPHFAYPDLRPTTGSLLRHAPAAAANALSRPWLGESKEPLYVVAGLENLALLSLLALSGWAAWRGRAGQLPFGLVLALVIYCLVLMALLGLSTPNLGSLHRYRSGLLPYLLLLLLQNDFVVAALGRLGLRNDSFWRSGQAAGGIRS